MVYEVRLLAPVKTRKLEHKPRVEGLGVQPSMERDRMKAKALRLDPLDVLARSRRDDDFAAGVARGPRQIETVGPEEPVVGTEKQQLHHACSAASRRTQT